MRSTMKMERKREAFDMNRSEFLNQHEDDLEQEDEDNEDLDNEIPYNTISDRPPLEDPNKPQMQFSSQAQMPISQAVKEKIGSKFNPPPPSPSIPAEMPDYSSDPMMQRYDSDQNELNGLREDQKKGNFIANLGDAFSTLAAGADKPISDPFYKSLIDQNKQPILSKEKDLDRRRMIINAIENRKAKQLNTNAKHAQTEAINKYRQEEKQTKAHDALLKDARHELSRLNSRINEDRNSGRTVLGKAAGTKQSIAIVEALLAGETDLNNIDSRQMYEVATGLDRVVSGGGAPKIGSTEHLDQKTLYRKMQEVLEWWTNKRRGAGGADFLKTIQHSLEREKKVANEQIRAAKDKELAGHLYIKKAIPDEWEDMLNRQGLSEFKIEEMPQSTAQAELQKGQSSEKKIIRKQYSPSRNQTKITYDNKDTKVLNGKY